jgi:magnesium chelatase family protein
MMAKRLPSILPPLSLAESLETTQIHSIAGKLSRNATLIAQRPFRAPHHTISEVALVGGGNNPQPGEISLAHNGVLFLDELTEFNKQTLEVLRQPLEDRHITISRASTPSTCLARSCSWPRATPAPAAIMATPPIYVCARPVSEPVTCRRFQGLSSTA